MIADLLRLRSGFVIAHVIGLLFVSFVVAIIMTPSDPQTQIVTLPLFLGIAFYGMYVGSRIARDRLEQAVPKDEGEARPE